jgi:hypothetical protein
VVGIAAADKQTRLFLRVLPLPVIVFDVVKTQPAPRKKNSAKLHYVKRAG